MGRNNNLCALLGLALLAFLPGTHAGENNLWPLLVEQEQSLVGRDDQWSSLGPIGGYAERERRDVFSVRPFFTRFVDRESGYKERYFLYPMAAWKEKGPIRNGNVFAFTQYRRNEELETTFYQNFPFFFYNRTPDPESNYFAFFPFGGTLKNRFWRDRIDFAAWPLFVRTKRGDEVRTHTPYPFIQRLKGPQSRGFGLWPLYGQFERDEDYQHSWALWPLHYHYRDQLDQPVPYVRFGMLPFYHRETAAGLRSESFLWPFFGYTRERDPRPDYAENRYLWPLLVQGHGEEKFINRWMPVFTHEGREGYEKRWFMWPTLKVEDFSEPGLDRRRTSFLYFLYRDDRQRFAGREARLTTLWPLVSYWNDGAGRSQMQVPDPLTVFFPGNQKIKENWSPLFALYRHDERAGNRRHSLLWDFLVWERDQSGLRSFHLGPLFEWVQGSHWKIFKAMGGQLESAPAGEGVALNGDNVYERDHSKE